MQYFYTQLIAHLNRNIFTRQFFVYKSLMHILCILNGNCNDNIVVPTSTHVHQAKHNQN